MNDGARSVAWNPRIDRCLLLQKFSGTDRVIRTDTCETSFFSNCENCVLVSRLDRSETLGEGRLPWASSSRNGKFQA